MQNFPLMKICLLLMTFFKYFAAIRHYESAIGFRA
jgi:hypothetical protein